MQLFALVNLGNSISIDFIPCTGEHSGGEDGFACYKPVSRVVDVALQRTATLCLDLHGNIVDVKFFALGSCHRELYILTWCIVDACRGPGSRASCRSYQRTIAIHVAIRIQSFVFHGSCCGIAVDYRLVFISFVQCPRSRKRVATTQLNTIDSDSSVDRLRAYRSSNRTVEGTSSRNGHFSIERLDECAVLVVDRE